MADSQLDFLAQVTALRPALELAGQGLLRRTTFPPTAMAVRRVTCRRDVRDCAGSDIWLHVKRREGLGGSEMNTQLEPLTHGKGQQVVAKIGNAAECHEGISAAIAKRASEIFQRRGCLPGHDQENRRLAESEVLQPLWCGLADSKDEIVVSLFSSALKGIEEQEVEVCVEPNRLILVGKKGSERGKEDKVYHVLPLGGEFDPSSAKLRQQGSLLEIEIRKAVRKNPAVTLKVA